VQRSVIRPWAPLAIVAAAFLLSIVLYSRLPERFATHWDASGTATGWSSRARGAFLLPWIMLAVTALLLLLPRIDPRRANYEKFGGVYALIVYSVLGVQLVLHAAILVVALGWHMPIDTLAIVSIGVLLIATGSVLPQTHSNFFVGIRTPWTLSSDTVWARTHQVGGYTMTAAGLVVILSAALPGRARLAVLLTAVIVGVLVPVVYSYVVWARESGA
jgi:uncharacterized membrane protein